MNKIIAYSTSLVLLLLFQAISAVNLYATVEADTIDQQIILYNDVLFENNSIFDADSITVEVLIDGDYEVWGDAAYNIYDSVILFDLHYADSNLLLADYQSNLRFSLWFTDSLCRAYSTNYTIDSNLSNYNRIVLTSLKFSNHYFGYSETLICENKDSILPYTDIPISALTLDSISPGLTINPNFALDISSSNIGTFYIEINSDYCIDIYSSKDTIQIIQADSIDLSDTIFLCRGSEETNIDLSDYNIYALDDSSTIISLPDLTASGDFEITLKESSMCTSIDTIFIELIETEPVFIDQIESCDRVTLSFESEDNENKTCLWSTGESSESIEVFESVYISIELEDEYGCLSSDSIDVMFSPFSIYTVDIEKEDETCWEPGRITINSINDSYNYSSEYTCNIINSITGEHINNLDEVNAGIYSLEISNTADCVYEYPEKITLIQKCHDDYPVFSPNMDGIEDEYFIPHTGRVRIFDINGKLLKTIEGPAYWNGSNDSGSSIPMGNYLIVTDTDKIVNITIIR